MRAIRRYSELVKIETFEERFRYLALSGEVGKETFGFDRFINQGFYNRSKEWKEVRDFVIIRDNGCDLGIEGREIFDRMIVHHMNPLRLEDFLDRSDFLLNPEHLITTCHSTHNAIHYGNEELLIKEPIPRFKNDTCPWRQ